VHNGLLYKTELAGSYSRTRQLSYINHCILTLHLSLVLFLFFSLCILSCKDPNTVLPQFFLRSHRTSSQFNPIARWQASNIKSAFIYNYKNLQATLNPPNS
jgi:hypothetical protein